MKIFLTIFLIFVVLGAFAFLFSKNSEIIIENSTALKEYFSGDTESIAMLAVGDVMLGRYVETLMDEHGMFYPFEKIRFALRNFDIVFGNLEGPINFGHKQTRNSSSKFSFKPDIAPLLGNNYFNIVSLANNHTMDMGEKGYDDTVFLLNDNDILPFGHMLEIGDTSLARKSIKGENLAFIGFNATDPDFNENEALELVEDESSKASFSIVSMHWGREYQTHSNQRQRDFAHKLIDVGADLIIGHHPHVVQEIEAYKNGIIFYSLGNFIFDQYFSQDVQQGLMVSLKLGRDEAIYYLMPIESHLSQPKIMGDGQREDFLQKLALKSEGGLSEVIRNGEIAVLRD